MTVPYWVSDAVFYHIFPDRFANGEPANDPPNVSPWDAAPTPYSFHGGDLRGIIQHFDYLLDLGINAIYLNPIFQASSNHRYNTYDNLRIDPKLGDLQDFKALVNLAHQNDVRIILDGVFNHCGRGFFAFNDVLENQDKSPYKDWFFINKYPLDAYSKGDAQDYQAWWKIKSLPKFNTKNPEVRRYLLGVARYWIEQGVDGWRLDVPNEIDDDNFWFEFKQTILSVNRDAYLLGEIWDVNPRWANDRHFDGLMNYPFRSAILDLLNEKTLPTQFSGNVAKVIEAYPKENLHAMYTLLGSHDTERALTLFKGDTKKLKLAALLLFSLPGVPSIYYGDEIGLTGGKDPECRKSFPWNPSQWNQDLRDWFRTLIFMRKRYACLRRGEYTLLSANDQNRCLAFTRSLGETTILIAANASQTAQTLRLKVGDINWRDGQIVHDLLNGEEFLVSGDELTLSFKELSGRLIGLGPLGFLF